MLIFVVQTILLLIVAFMLGTLLGKLLKGMFCSSRMEPATITTSNQGVSEGIDHSYTSSADKLADRDGMYK